MPTEGALLPPWAVLVWSLKPCCLYRSSSFTFLRIWSIWEKPPQPWLLLPYCDRNTCRLATHEGSNWRALVEARNPLGQFESSAIQSADIMFFGMAALSLLDEPRHVPVRFSYVPITGLLWGPFLHWVPHMYRAKKEVTRWWHNYFLFWEWFQCVVKVQYYTTTFNWVTPNA